MSRPLANTPAGLAHYAAVSAAKHVALTSPKRWPTFTDAPGSSSAPEALQDHEGHYQDPEYSERV